MRRTRYVILPVAILLSALSGCVIPPPKPPVQPTPTPVTGGQSCGDIGGPTAQCVGYAAACPEGMESRGATYDCAKCCAPVQKPTPSPTATPVATPVEIPFDVTIYGCGGARIEALGLGIQQLLLVECVNDRRFTATAQGPYDQKVQSTDNLTQQLANWAPHLQQAKQNGVRHVAMLSWCGGCELDTHWFSLARPDKTCTRVETERGEFGFCRTSLPNLRGYVVDGIEVVDPTTRVQLAAIKDAGTWDNVPYIVTCDECGLNKAQAEAHLADVIAQEDALGLPHKPLMMTFTDAQLATLDGHLASNLDLVGIEAYGAGYGDGDLEGALDAALARVPIGKKVIVWYAEYNRNGEWTASRQRLAGLIRRTTLWIQAHRSRVAGTISFTWIRGFCQNGYCQGGARDYRDLMVPEEIQRRRYLDSGGTTAWPAIPEPTPVPTPVPDAQGIVGWAANNVGSSGEGQPLTLTLFRSGAGSHAGLCSVAYTIESARGTNVPPASGTAVLDRPDATYSITITRPADPLPTGYAQAVVRLGAATGCVPERGLGRATWPDDQPSITWMTTSAVVGSGITLVRFGSTAEPVRVTTDCWGAVVFERGVATLFRNVYEPLTCTITSAPGYTIVDPVAVVR
jgi:hypothetical protein